MTTGPEREEQVRARLAAQHAVARELFRSASLEEAAPGVLAAITEALGWEMADVWEVPPGGGDLQFVAAWEREPGRGQALWRESRALTLASGVGLPGHALEAGTLVWIDNLPADPNFVRAPAAAEAGLVAGLAMPAPAGRPENVVAVCEFFSREPVAPDPELRELLVAFGDQLAQFVRRRRAEQAVRASEALKSAILDSALDCVITMDHEGRVREWNPAAEQTFGHRRQDVIGREMAEVIIPPGLRDQHRAGLRRYLETGEGPILDRRIELSALRADGSQFPVELTVTRIAGTDPPLFAGNVRDITATHAAERSRRHLAAIVETTDDAVVSADPEGRITAWNPGAERIFGYPAAEALGRQISFLAPADLHQEQREVLALVTGGEPLYNYETQRLRADGTSIDVALTVSPLTGDDDQIHGVSLIARDMTARKRAERAKEFLAGASAALDASLNPEQTLRTIARIAVPELAELCVIDLLEPGGGIGKSVAAATDPALAAELEDLRRRFPIAPDGDHPVARALRSGEPAVLRDLGRPEVLSDVAQSEEHREFILRAGYTSAAVVPMIARGRTLGAISMLQARGDRPYDPPDLDLLRDLARRAAMALDNARLYAERTHVAQTLQASLLPAQLPLIPGAAVSAAYLPSGEGNEVGGDFYDVFKAGEGWMLIVGDVCGKGAEAAAVTALIRNSVRTLSMSEHHPARVLDQVNEVMLRQELDSRFATAILARMELGDGGARVEVATAGHPPPVVVRKAGSPDRARGTGALLGALEDVAFTPSEVRLGGGDTLVLYTDGVLEAGAPERVLSPGELQGLLAGCAGADTRQVVQRLEREALEASGGVLRDDVAILAVTVNGG